MAIKLPAALKRLRPMHWAIIGGVVLAALYLYSRRGSSTSTVPNTGVSGTSGGTTTDTSTAATADTTVPTDWAAVFSQQQGALADWQSQLLATLGQSTSGTETPGTPGGTVSSSGGLPPVSNLPNPASQYTADTSLSYQNPADLLSQIYAAVAAGKTQVLLPSGDVWATNQATIDQIKTNIAALGTGTRTTAGISPGGTTATATAATAARVAQLQAAITTQTKNVAVNTKAGKTTAAATDQTTLTKYKTELAKLTA
jgi:hypothetical protein